MSARLEQALADYLATRRALGFKLDRAQKLIAQFIAYLDERGTEQVTIEDALAWAVLPADADPWWWALRLSAVRAFAAWLHTLDDTVQVPPPGLIRCGPRRATPYLYSDADIVALVDAAGALPRPLSAITYQTLIGLLAVTGMRVGEAIGLDRDDFDADHGGMATVREAKFAKTRQVPLHPSTVSALSGYLQARDHLLPAPTSTALLISTTGTRLSYNAVWRTVHQLITRTGLGARTPSCQPRIHDLRHSFAVATLRDWYANGADVHALLPVLSTYLGHADPKHTYWYLSAAPELLALAGRRLEPANHASSR